MAGRQTRESVPPPTPGRRLRSAVASRASSEPDTTRKWPDDFRGFGTNVRPKKQK